MIDITHLFSNVIGQAQPKKQIIHLLNKHQEIPHTFDPLMLNASKGRGKTLFAEQIAKGLFCYDDKGVVLTDKGKPKIKPFLPINCSQLKSLSSFVEDYLLKINNIEATLFFDEAGVIPEPIAYALLTILNTNEERKNTFEWNGGLLEFDLTKQSFIFATAEPQLVNEMLMDRLDKIDLEEYSLEELGEIIKLNLPDIEFKEDSLTSISSSIRGNCRNAFKLAQKIKGYLGEKKIFKIEDWEKIKEIFGISPLGLNNSELNILKEVHNAPNGISLTGLSSKTGFSVDCIRRTYEKYLIKQNLIAITNGKGRQITPKGIEYLEKSKNQKFKVEVKEL